MGQFYWLNRQQSALRMAQGAEAAETRLIHYELAGRYSIVAAQTVGHPLARAHAAALLARRLRERTQGPSMGEAAQPAISIGRLAATHSAQEERP